MLENYSIAKIIDVNKFNDVLKLFRVTAFVLRFINNVKKKIKKKEIVLKSHFTTIEMSEAKLLWLQDNQSQLKQSKNYLEIKNTLNLHEDDKLIRSYNRLKNVKTPFDNKAPITLDRNYKLTELLILYSNHKVLHRGVKQTLTEFRQQYWITRDRSCVEKVIQPFIICKKLNGRPYLYPQHSDTPEFRFDDITLFHSVGVDYLGPLMCLPVYDVKVKLYKVWVVIYTCDSTRAIILDVVHNYHSSTFINCFKRFKAKRGCPSTVISDNGKTFISEYTQTFVSNHFINWKFNVEKAPSWGGMWERLVSCVKRCIKKVVGNRTITYIELQTLVQDIELILNNRPIDVHYDDQEDILSPSHLIFGRQLPTTNMSTQNSYSDLNLSKRKKMLQTILNHFWSRWRRDYVTSLRQFQKSKQNKSVTQAIKKNGIVIIYDEKVHVTCRDWDEL